MTHSASVYKVQTKLRVIDRVWGSDGAFLDAERDRFDRVVAEKRLLLVRLLILLGRMPEAKAELGLLRDPPYLERVLTLVPGPFARAAASARRAALALRDLVRG